MYKNYTMNQIILPLNLEVKLDKNDIAFAVNDLVESIPENHSRILHGVQDVLLIIHV